jgi:hypothetical protein
VVARTASTPTDHQQDQHTPREVADLPTLLSAAGPEAFTSGKPGSGPPATLLPRLLESARRERHRLRRLAAITTLAVAAGLLAIITLVALHPRTPG